MNTRNMVVVTVHAKAKYHILDWRNADVDCRLDHEHRILRLLDPPPIGTEYRFQADRILGFNTKERETVTTAGTAAKTDFCAPPEQQFGAINESNDVLCLEPPYSLVRTSALCHFDLRARCWLTRHVLLLDPTSHWLTVWEVILFPDAMDSTIWVIATTVVQ